MRLRILTIGLLFVAIPSIAAGATATQADSVKTFVQAFYDWYVPLALTPKDDFSYDIVLKQRPDSFSSILREALKGDLEASEKSPEEIVGLDFDPILASQDPCNHYVASTVKQVGKHYEVDVSCSGESHHEPDVIAEVAQQGNSWVFVDFIYPPSEGFSGNDLLSLLKKLKQERDEPVK